jgi:hypothetical protein
VQGLLAFLLLCASVPCINCENRRVRRHNETEAIRTVAALHAAQERYLAQHGTYATHLRDLGSSGENKGYRFRLTTRSRRSLCNTARQGAGPSTPTAPWSFAKTGVRSPPVRTAGRFANRLCTFRAVIPSYIKEVSE